MELNKMNKLLLTLATVLICISCASHKVSDDMSQYDIPDVIRRTTDPGFGGFYLDIEKTMAKYKISRMMAHEIQNQMRDELESLSNSFSIFHQAPYLKGALEDAVYNVTVLKNFESGYEPTNLKQGEFYVVLDLDETVLTQWYHNGAKDTNERRAHLGVSIRDKALRTMNRETGENLSEKFILNGPAVVTFRPKVDEFLKGLEKISGYKGFFVFTAKEDLSAWDIVDRWKSKQPRLFRKLKGVFTRNYLTYGGPYKKPSKDLRIVDESLKHVFLVDDNESRVVQKDLNYRIPKFSADYYWDHYMNEKSSANSNEKWVFESVLDYVLVQTKSCSGKNVIACLSKKLGSTDQDREPYFKWLKQRLPNIVIDRERIKTIHLFHQDWVCKDYVRTYDTFPHFINKTFKF
jgi:hypothetical protein